MKKISHKTFKKIITRIIIWQAKVVLLKYKPKVIAITGSVGKTSTKDAIFTVLSKTKKVRKSEKSFNSEIGLPLTVLGLPSGWNDPFVWMENILKGFALILFKNKYPEILILEVGVSKPGDIKKYVLPWLKTDILVYTRFPDKPAHIEFFDSALAVIEEKSALLQTLKKGGLLILNQDDEKVSALHQKSKERTVSFGQEENSTYKVSYPGLIYTKHGNIDIPEGVNFKLEYKGNVYPVILPHVLGLHNIMQASSALACSQELDCDLLRSIQHLTEYRNPPGRLSLIEGINNSIIIDDSYNSSPVAVVAALEIFKEIKSKRKIIILGDMLELGKHTEEEHRAVGKAVVGMSDILITVGPRSLHIREGAVEAGFNEGNIFSFDGWRLAAEFTEKLVGEGDAILVKGSQGMRLERLVEAIMMNKKDKRSLLCRQDKEWENK